MKSFFWATLALGAFGLLSALAAVPVGLSLATDVAAVAVMALILLKWIPGQAARLFFITLCVWVVLRYVFWRFATLPLDVGITTSVASVALLCAELYGVAMLLLGLFVNAMPLERKPPKLPASAEKCPKVDIYIPTYSEPVSVVKRTLVAAMDIDYPAERFNVYVLDDGWPRAQNPKTDPETAMELRQRTKDLQALCERHGATWLTRAKNEHAKSGNMNSAMAQTDGELILILDADHVPTRDILRNTAGFFVHEKRLAFVQTPHFFVNADPVERNLQLQDRMPGESEMFYRVVQKGLDLWNTSFFCGSAALIRRRAVIDVGGFSVDSITEDASTSVKMHQKGWKSAYYGRPMVAGLQPETFAGFTVQRLRWAMGMAQIMLKQNPLVIRGLAPAQRLAYLSVVMFWVFPFARVIFFLAPFLSLFFNLTVYPVGVEYFVAYTVPYLAAVLLSFQKMFGKVRRFLISEVYETLQSFYAFPALISTMLRPNKPTFKVTPKGETLKKEFISELTTPFYIFYVLTLAGLTWGLVRMLMEPESRSALALSVSWLFFNFMLLSVALGVLVERVQQRQNPRIDVATPVTAVTKEGPQQALLVDINEDGARVKFFDLQSHEIKELVLDSVAVPVTPLREGYFGEGIHVVRFPSEQPEHERAVIRAAYGDSQRWMDLWVKRESSSNMLVLTLDLMRIAFKGATYHINKLLDLSK